MSDAVRRRTATNRVVSGEPDTTTVMTDSATAKVERNYTTCSILNIYFSPEVNKYNLSLQK